MHSIAIGKHSKKKILEKNGVHRTPLRKIRPRQIPPAVNSHEENYPRGKFPRGKLPRILFSNYFCLKDVSPLKNLIFYLRGRLT